MFNGPAASRERPMTGAGSFWPTSAQWMLYLPIALPAGLARLAAMPSTIIRSFRYLPDTGELDVLFTTGRRYVYSGVPPEAASAFRAAFAKGRHFNAHIRGRYSYTEQPPEGADETFAD
jgi:hypothetical protein